MGIFSSRALEVTACSSFSFNFVSSATVSVPEESPSEYEEIQWGQVLTHLENGLRKLVERTDDNVMI